eukprot:1703902-Amphidinium_carterae.1
MTTPTRTLANDSFHGKTVTVMLCCQLQWFESLDVCNVSFHLYKFHVPARHRESPEAWTPTIKTASTGAGQQQWPQDGLPGPTSPASSPTQHLRPKLLSRFTVQDSK